MLARADIARLRPTIASIWLGMLIGVSFLATPIKFQAAGLDLPTALDIGRLTFQAFSRVEWVLAAGLVGTVWASRPSRGCRIATAVVLAALALQVFWLLPVLTARIEAIISGMRPEASWHHVVYACVEITKALALLAVGLPMRNSNPDRESDRSEEKWRSNAM